MTADAFPPAPRRTWFTNLAGAVAILSGGIGSLFSAFALLMAIGKPCANSAVDPPGIFLIFILPMLLFLLAIAAACLWFAGGGVREGEVRLPVKLTPVCRIVSRDEKPVRFWISILIVSALGSGCTAFAG